MVAQRQGTLPHLDTQELTQVAGYAGAYVAGARANDKRVDVADGNAPLHRVKKTCNTQSI
jgi:hypothetical protein